MTNTKYQSQRILITGGTGSFGKAVARYLLDQGVQEVRVVSRDEAKQHDMRIELADPRLKFYLGDVRNIDSLERCIDGVDAIFHGAALKQVPSCEFFPIEAVFTNILGSDNVIRSAQKYGVESVVCLSTDKAVLPVNAMGMSKALMEKVAQSYARTSEGRTVVSTVRYGNVLYSRGSVVPAFVERIFRREPLLLTDPAMTRFLMPLADAVEMVEFALLNAEPGDTFVRKADAATIEDIATAVSTIFDHKIEHETIGVRHGEKLYETLATVEELHRAEEIGDYWRVRMDARDLNYSEYFEVGVHRKVEGDYHSHNTGLLDVEQISDLLRSLPEMQDALKRWQQLR